LRFRHSANRQANTPTVEANLQQQKPICNNDAFMKPARACTFTRAKTLAQSLTVHFVLVTRPIPVCIGSHASEDTFPQVLTGS
jgi:hypothetical protein